MRTDFSSYAHAQRVLHLCEVFEIAAVSRSTLRCLRGAGEFPQPIRLATRAITWRASDIESRLESRQCESTAKKPKRVYRWGHSQAPPKSRDDDLSPFLSAIQAGGRRVRKKLARAAVCRREGV